MKITEILEIADKREGLHEDEGAKSFAVICQYEDLQLEMESKLREIHKLLPDIKTAIRWLIKTYSDKGWSLIIEKDLLDALEKWELQ